MRRAIQLRMIFSLVFFLAGEGGIKGEGRRQHDSDKVEPRLMVVSADDRDQMNQGVAGQEAGACDRGRPISRPPGPRGESETGDKERHADILDKMRVERPGSGCAGYAGVPEWAGDEHRQPVEEGGDCENCCYQALHEMGTSCTLRRGRRSRCDRTDRKSLAPLCSPWPSRPE